MITKILTLVIFSLATLVGVWDLLQIEALDNALIQFATAGAVPGTHVILSPGQMFIAMSCMLLLVICLLFRRGLIRDIRELRALLARPVRRGRQTVRRPEPQPMAIVDDEPYSTAERAMQTAATAPANNRVVIVTTIPGTPGLIAQAFRYIRPRMMPALYSISHAAWLIVRSAGRWAAHVAIEYDRKSRIYTVKAWRYAELHIRRWDAAIERRLKQYPAISRALETAGREYIAARTYIGSSRSHSSRAVEK